MPKALCIAALAISFIVLLFFLTDLLFGWLMGMPGLALFNGSSWLMDIVFSLCAVGLGYMSWKTFKEQV